MLYKTFINMNGVPYKISKNIIGSIDIIEKISSYVTPTVFKNTYPTLLKLKPKLLDHMMNLMWDETEKPSRVMSTVNVIQAAFESSKSPTY